MIFKKLWVALFLLAHFSAAYPEHYQFTGTHYIASYLDCDAEALCDLSSLEEAMVQSALASGATILDLSQHIFPPDAMTMVLLLSESHASIHTYPEHQACFVDLFTCGNSCDYKQFEKVLVAYLKPKLIEHHVLTR